MPAEFLTAAWKDLIMANYLVDEKLLQPLVPKGTRLDLYNGNAYVSLVGFMFTDTKLLGAKIPFHVNFEEVNLRFYVQYKDGALLKRGTVFIREIVPRYAISWIANTFYREKYITLPMRHTLSVDGDLALLNYKWKYRNQWNFLEAAVLYNSFPMLPESKEAFIAEHYWGYAKYSDIKTLEYEVRHPAWNIYPLIRYSIDCNFEALYGAQFAHLRTAEPDSVFVAEGSAISILHKRTL